MPDRVSAYHLAQLNVGVPLAPVTTPQLAGFMAALEPINRLADRSPGFIWRLQTETGDATSIRAFDDERILINMSVWASLESLRDFVYQSGHVAVMRRRREWFERLGESHLCLWWLPAGELPSIEEASRRLALIRRLGSTPDAFTFREPFGPPDAAIPRGPLVSDEFCWPAPPVFAQ